MRKVIASLFISLDGVVQDPFIWQREFDEDMGAAMSETLANQDTVLLGRVTYDDWAPYWPTATDEPFASYINTVPKYVFSSTLTSADWNNTTLVTGSLADTITELRQQEGKTIGVAGSPTLVRSLLREGLLDELTLLIHPVIAGTGKHLFEEGDALQHLEVVTSTTSSSGTIIVTYRPRRDDA